MWQFMIDPKILFNNRKQINKNTKKSIQNWTNLHVKEGRFEVRKQSFKQIDYYLVVV